jgi:hypothetical protein
VKSFRCCCLGLLLAPLLLVLPACGTPEEPPQPADLVPKATMITLLADLHLLEARVENSRLPVDSARALYLAQQKELLWKREVSDSAFQRSYRYYGIHGKDLDDIYAAVVDTLGRREARVDPAGRTQKTWAPTPTPPK